MLKVSRLSDYGVVVLHQLMRSSHEPERSLSAKFLAEKTGLPLPTVSKLLKLLTKNQIIEAKQGVSGGYRLKKAPEQISILNVLESIEGSPSLTTCTSDSLHQCLINNACPHKNAWTSLNQKVNGLLQGINLKNFFDGNF